MIIDKTINKKTAKYYCLFAGVDFKKIKQTSKNIGKTEIDKAQAIQIASQPKNAKIKESTQIITEGFFSSLVDFFSTPAWVEEPTGFNDPRPTAVFKDPQAGIDGYNKGQKIGAAAAAAVGAVAGSSMMGRPSDGLKAALKAAKVAVKHPIATAAAGAAIAYPDNAAKVADAAVEVTKEVGKQIINKDSAFHKIRKFFKPLTDFAIDHPYISSTIGLIGYGLIKTRNLWWKYVKRACYEITSGKSIAICEFDSFDEHYKFEFSMNKMKWTLLNGASVASEKDTQDLFQTQFCQQFISRCEKILRTAFENGDFLVVSTEMIGINESSIKNILKNKDAILANIYKI